MTLSSKESPRHLVVPNKKSKHNPVEKMVFCYRDGELFSKADSPVCSIYNLSGQDIEHV